MKCCGVEGPDDYKQVPIANRSETIYEGEGTLHQLFSDDNYAKKMLLKTLCQFRFLLVAATANGI